MNPAGERTNEDVGEMMDGDPGEAVQLEAKPSTMDEL